MVDNIQRRKLFIDWRNSVNPADVYFSDETGFCSSSDKREHGRSLTNRPVPIVMVNQAALTSGQCFLSLVKIKA